MDIHKPKPWHSVREFLKEYVIIVVGVLTALAAEQAVEALRTQHEVREITAALDGSIGVNLVWAAERVAVGPCMRARLVEVRDKLVAAGDTWPADPQAFPGPADHTPPAVPEAFHSPHRDFGMAAWQAALASRDANALPLARRGIYASIFLDFESLQTLGAQQHQVEQDLDALSFDLRLTPDLRAHLLSRLGALARVEAATDVVAHQTLARSRRGHWTVDRTLLAETLAAQRRRNGVCVQDVTP